MVSIKLWDHYPNPKDAGREIAQFTNTYLVWQRIVWFPGRPVGHSTGDVPFDFGKGEYKWRRIVTIGRVIAVGHSPSARQTVARIVQRQDGHQIRVPVRMIHSIETTGEDYKGIPKKAADPRRAPKPLDTSEGERAQRLTGNPYLDSDAIARFEESARRLGIQMPPPPPSIIPIPEPPTQPPPAPESEDVLRKARRIRRRWWQVWPRNPLDGGGDLD